MLLEAALGLRPIIHVCCSLQKPKMVENVMRAIKVDKLVLNISAGGSGDKLTKAVRVLHQISEQEPVTSKGTFVCTIYM